MVVFSVKKSYLVCFGVFVVVYWSDLVLNVFINGSDEKGMKIVFIELV